MKNIPKLVYWLIAVTVMLTLYYALYFVTAIRTVGGSYEYKFHFITPGYGTPKEIRKLGNDLIGVDVDRWVHIFFKPAFEIDRRYLRRKFWKGFDLRDVGSRADDQVKLPQ